MLRSGQKGNRQKPYKKENPSDPIGGNPAGIAKVIRAFIHEYNSNSAQEKSYRAVADRRQQKTLTWTKTATVLVGVYTGVTIVLAIIRGRQLNVSEDSEQRQLRAYVGAVGMELSCGNCLPTVKDQIYLSTENFGQTPAYLIQGTIWPYEYSINDPFPIGDIRKAPLTSLPIDFRSMAIYPKDPVKQLFAINNASAGLFKDTKSVGGYWLLWRGFVQYRDVFDRVWNIYCCFEYNPTKYPKTPFIQCPKYYEERSANQQQPQEAQPPQSMQALPDIPPYKLQ